jgi:hypothetical protein
MFAKIVKDGIFTRVWLYDGAMDYGGLVVQAHFITTGI